MISICIIFFSEPIVCDFVRVSYCTKGGIEYNDDEHKQLLASFADGGSIDVEKDEESGIATVTVSDPDVRNAISGMCFLVIHLKCNLISC